MYYLGVDCHKRLSYVTALNEEGQVVFKGALSNTKEDFAGLIKKLGRNCKAVLETTFNWGVVFDLLDELGIETKLAHAHKLRAIAETQIKNDVKDSKILAHLLRTNLIPEVYIPPKKTRLNRNILRERMFVVKTRTAIKNRIHQLLVRNHVNNDVYSDMFGKAGRRFIDKLEMYETEGKLLNRELETLDYLDENRKYYEKLLKQETKDNRYFKLIKSIPGFGEVLSLILALEIDNINRFKNQKKFASYCGVVPSEHSSSDKIYRGPTVRHANKYLKWALIEASWKAIKCSPYFKQIYIRVKFRRGSNKAIVSVARHIAEIVYKMLKENRPYEERFYNVNKRNNTAALDRV